MQMEHVQVGHEFWEKERLNYGNYGLSVWRELFQNSRDARSTEISVQLIDRGEGKYQIIFDDNGIGMDEDVLRDVFFRLGATTKHDSSTEGGFGKARTLICFSNEKYQIDTHGHHVEGSYGMFRIESRQWRRGCCFTIDINAIDRWGSRIDMMDKLHQYLSMSAFYGCKVTVNGEDWRTWSYCNRLTRELTFGKVFVNKSGSFGGILIVRVNGAMMFTESVRCSEQVIVELDQTRAREILVSNRDGLNYEYRNELNSFIQSVAVDKTSALRGKDKYITWFGQEAVETHRPDKKPKVEEVGYVDAAISLNPTFDIDNVVGELNRGTEKGEFAKSSTKIEESQERLWTVDDLIPSTALIVETENQAIRKVIHKYNPESWRDKEGSKRKKFLKLWAIACMFAVEEYLRMYNLESLKWRPAYLFSDEAAARHLRASNGDAVFAINPVCESGKMKFSLRKHDDRCMLISLAVHEVCHEALRMHDEDYANLLTRLEAKVFARGKDLFKTMSMVLKRA